jgi:hypothetical protein
MLDIARYAVAAVVALLVFYVLLRVGTLAILRSIAEFRAAENAQKSSPIKRKVEEKPV